MEMAGAKNGRRVEVRTTAARLFREHGYDATPMDLLAEELQLNKGTIYYYYKSKADLLYDIVVQPLTSLSEVIDQIPVSEVPEDELRALVGAMVSQSSLWANEVAVYFNQYAWLPKVLKPEQVASIRQHEDRYRDRIVEILSRLQGRDDVRAFDRMAGYYAIVGMASYIPNWFAPGKRLSIDEIAEEFSSLILYGVGRAADRLRAE
jgi:AcrR family transcriptional regulator